ncbi:MAG: D-aminoacyl-tRNA deacylase [Flavobacteriaceae bacterium]|nr:D-aminoacyl-tRNA deacylase [Flavobacteriaceae bacterium]
MRAVVQRVSQANVSSNGENLAKIKEGLLVLLGIAKTDTKDDVYWLSNKLANLRVFNDCNNMMNISLKDNDGSAIVVSQFTLHAKIRKGNRPSYVKAANSDVAKSLYEQFINQFEADLEKKVQSGKFGANMKVELTNDGPITIIIDTKQRE